MLFFSKILGYREFASVEDIKKRISQGYYFPEFEEPEDVKNAESIIFFQTKRQQTWLLVTDMNMYCILDDIAKEDFEIKWNIHRSKLINENKEIILNIKITPEFKEFSGRIDFGKIHKGWLYSKKLYPYPNSLETDIKNLILLKMS